MGSTFTLLGGAAVVSEWEDLGTHLRSGSFTRGRSNELDHFQVGTCELDLENTDRVFDPSTRGPLLGSPVELSVVVTGGSTFGLFRGHIGELPQSWAAARQGDAVATARAFDAFDLLGRKVITSPWEDYVEQDLTYSLRAWWPLGESTDAVTAEERIADYHANILGTPVASSGLVPGDSGTALRYPSTHVANPQGVRLPVSGVLGSSAYGPLADNVGAGSFNTMVTTCWVGPSDSTADGGIFSVSSTGSTAVAAVIRSVGGNRIQAEQHDVNSVTSATVTSSALSEGPHFVAVKWSMLNLRLWIDGALVDSTTPGGGAGGRRSWSSPLKPNRDWIAKEIGTGGAPTHHGGGIQHFQVAGPYASSGVAPSTTEFAALYSAGVAAWEGDTADVRLDRILDQIAWPSTRRVFDVGISALGAAGEEVTEASAVDHGQIIGVDAEAGRVFVDGHGDVVFHNRHRTLLSTAYSNAQLQITDQVVESTGGTSDGIVSWTDLALRYTVDDVTNEATVSIVGGEAKVARSTASMDAYGTRRVEMTDLPLLDSEEAQERAYWLVSVRSEPELRVESVDLNLGQSPETPADVLGVEIGDRVDVVHTPSTGAAVTIPAVVESISVDFNVQTQDAWNVTFGLSNIGEDGSLILDSTTQGLLDTNSLGF